MDRPDTLRLLLICAWLLIGRVAYRYLNKDVHFATIMYKQMGYRKSAFAMEVLAIVFWPIGGIVTFPFTYVIYRITQKKQKENKND